MRSNDVSEFVLHTLSCGLYGIHWTRSRNCIKTFSTNKFNLFHLIYSLDICFFCYCVVDGIFLFVSKNEPLYLFVTFNEKKKSKSKCTRLAIYLLDNRAKTVFIELTLNASNPILQQKNIKRQYNVVSWKFQSIFDLA